MPEGSRGLFEGVRQGSSAHVSLGPRNPRRPGCRAPGLIPASAWSWDLGPRAQHPDPPPEAGWAYHGPATFSFFFFQLW